jgi:hypothetical protein
MFTMDSIQALGAIGQPIVPQAWVGTYAGNAQSLTTQGVLVPQHTIDPEVLAATTFLQDAAGAIIRRLHDYLQANQKQFSQLNESIPLVQRAVELYEARDFTRAYAQAYQAYRAIALVRARHPDVPSL